MNTQVEDKSEEVDIRSGREVYKGLKYFKRSDVNHDSVYMLDMINKFDCYVTLTEILNTIEFLLPKKVYSTFKDKILSFNGVVVDFNRRYVFKKKSKEITSDHFFKKQFSLRHIENKVGVINNENNIFAKEAYIREAFGLKSYLDNGDDGDDEDD